MVDNWQLTLLGPIHVKYLLSTLQADCLRHTVQRYRNYSGPGVQ